MSGLRFGVMANGLTFPRWQAECIRQVLSLPGVSAALLILDADAGAAPPKRGVLDRRIAWRAYNRFGVRGKLESARPVDLSAELGGVPSVVCRVERRGRHSQYFNDADLAHIRAHDLDFILRFAFNIIRGPILTTPRYGVWSYHHDDLDKYRGPPACFWEIPHDDPVTGVTLQRLTEGIDNGIVLQKAYFKTVLKSYARNRDAAFMASTSLPARVCRDLLDGHGGYVGGAVSKTTAPVFKVPENGAMLGFIAKETRNRIADAAGWLFRHDQWCVGVVDAPIHRFLDAGFEPQISWLGTPARGEIKADPFGIDRLEADGTRRAAVLYEALDYAANVGRIVAVEAETGDTGDTAAGPRAWSKPTIVEGLPTGVHLSYPFLIEHEGDIYCVPETSQAGEVGLYRATRFPDRWERVATLLEGLAVFDASIVRHAGRWWMFGGMRGEGASMRLGIWWSESLLAGWRPHRLMPAKIDVRSSRPGGTPFVHQGVLYRPAQDLSHTYGGRLLLQRVLNLSPDTFEEETAAVIEPRPEWPYRLGVHTLSKFGERTLIDAKRNRFAPVLLGRQLKKMLGRGKSDAS